MSTEKQPSVDIREQAAKFSTILEEALDKPRLDTITMREQILSNSIALIVMNHAHMNAPGNILGLNPPPMLITTIEEEGVRAEVISITTDNYTGRFHMRTQMQGSAVESDAEALLSLYEESKRVITNAKRIMEGLGLY